MYGQGFYMPIYSYPVRSAARMGGIGRLTGLLRGTNWGGLLNNASKALGVVNQAVPLVKQVGPIYNNMKSMLRVASLFKDETDNNIKQNKDVSTNNISLNNNNSYNTNSYYEDNTNSNNNFIYNDSYPNFFL